MLSLRFSGHGWLFACSLTFTSCISELVVMLRFVESHTHFNLTLLHFTRLTERFHFELGRWQKAAELMQKAATKIGSKEHVIFSWSLRRKLLHTKVFVCFHVITRRGSA